MHQLKLLIKLYWRHKIFSPKHISIRRMGGESIEKSDTRWLINYPVHLFKSKRFWVCTCLDWALNLTGSLLKEIKKTKRSGKYVFHKNHKLPKFHSKLIIIVLLFLMFKLASSFNWVFKRIWTIINSSSKIGYLLGFISRFFVYICFVFTFNNVIKM